MRVCARCGKPEMTMAVCSNCGSTAFKMIGQNRPVNNQPQTFNQPNYNQVPNGYQPQQRPVKPNQRAYAPVPNGAGYGAASGVAAGVATAAKTTSVAKIIIPIILAILVIVGATVGVVAVVNADDDGPERTINKFVECYNKVDINGCIDCFDSTIRDAYSGGSSLLSGVIGFNISDVASLLPFAAQMFDDEFGEMPKISMKVLDKQKTSSTTCRLKVEYSMDIDYSDLGDEYDDFELDPEIMYIDMVKEGGDWYISSDDLLAEF